MTVLIDSPFDEAAPRARPKLKRTMGLWMATALVVGNMVGSGVFLLPASLAGTAGPISMLAWVYTGAGAILLALVFANLGRAFPRKGGPYAYARRAFGDFIGFQTAWGRPLPRAARHRRARPYPPARRPARGRHLRRRRRSARRAGTDGHLAGVEAVVDNDLTAALLAARLGADALLLTDVEAVVRDFGAPSAKSVAAATPGRAARARPWAPAPWAPRPRPPRASPRPEGSLP
jgi:Amino acid permease